MAEVDGGLLLEAAQALVRAAEWELADRLLASAGNLDRAERAGRAVTRAQIAVEVRQWRGTGDPAPAIDAAAALPDLPADSGAAFDLDLLRLFRDYWTELVPEGAAPHLGPAGRDPRWAGRTPGPGGLPGRCRTRPQALRPRGVLRRADRR